MLISGGAVSAQDWEGFAASSDRTQDAFLIQTLKTGDLDTDLALCRGLGMRKDQDVQSIFSYLTAAYAAGAGARTELLLRWLIASARSSHPAEQDLRAWINDNSAAVDSLLADMSRWRAPMLKVELIALAVIARGPISQRAVMEAGSGIVESLRSSGGLLSGEDTALAVAFLDAAQRLRSPDFLQACADTARLSRDKTVVHAARAAAAASQ